MPFNYSVKIPENIDIPTYIGVKLLLKKEVCPIRNINVEGAGTGIFGLMLFGLHYTGNENRL